MLFDQIGVAVAFAPSLASGITLLLAREDP
jgi:hypothetical protein